MFFVVEIGDLFALSRYFPCINCTAYYFILHRCNCGLFIEKQFPEAINGPITWLGDTNVTVSCLVNLGQADSECDTICQNTGAYFEQNFDLSLRPPDNPTNPVMHF